MGIVPLFRVSAPAMRLKNSIILAKKGNDDKKFIYQYCSGEGEAWRRYVKLTAKKTKI